MLAVNKMGFQNADGTTGIEGAACPWPRGPRIGKRDGKGWYLLQVKSGAEVKIAEFLKPFGYEVYYPKTMILKRVPLRQMTPSQRKAGAAVSRPHIIPVFPGYPYIQFDLTDERCHQLFSFAGVYGLHCAGDRPVIVDDVYVNHLKSFEDSDTGMIPGSTALADLFAVGDHVRIQDFGPLRGFTAVIEQLPHKLQQQLRDGKLEELDESMCATIAIEIFGRVTLAKAPLSSLESLK